MTNSARTSRGSQSPNKLFFFDTIKAVTSGWINGIYFSSDFGTRMASVMGNFHIWTKSMLSMRMHLASMFETE